MFTLDRTSLTKLREVDEDLVRVVKRAASISPITFVVLEGRRTLARQRQLVEQGHSWTMNSRHLTGEAVDIAPLDGKFPSWAWPQYYALAPFIKRAAELEGVPVVWGGDWRKTKDGPHWQLKHRKPKT